MANDNEATSRPSESVGETAAASDSNRSTPSVVDKRSGRGKTDFADENTYKKTPNRLSNVRWPLGQEPYPDVPGTGDDEWINVKLDVTEHEKRTNQKHLLSGGAELRLNCHVCNQPMHIAGAKKAKEVLEEGGYSFKETRDYNGLDERVVVAACPQGHVTQLREDMARRLAK